MKKNFFYVPGIVSLTAIMLLLKFVTVPAFMPAKNDMVIRHFLASDDCNKPYSGCAIIGQAIKKKKIIHIDLTGDFEEDEKKQASSNMKQDA